jgi:uncharacterized membrane protein YphA (DoxX/SURF4 family)
MPTMNLEKPRAGSAGLLALRLAVAGILAWAGMSRFGGDAPPVAETLPGAAPAELEVDPTLATAADPIADDATVHPEQPEQVPTAQITPQGVQFDLGWNEFAGVGELIMAAALLLGVLTRFATLLGTGAIAASVLSAQGMIDLPKLITPLERAYQTNPAATLLLGAIFLALLIGGSGPGAIDNVWRRRRMRLKGAALPEAA